MAPIETTDTFSRGSIDLRLVGIHHITAITGDAPTNVDFYARLMGLRLVKKTVNFDAPDVYHLYYGDELGNPGSLITFFEFPGAPAGRAGAGMIHRLVWRVPGPEALDFWEGRLMGAGTAFTRTDESLRFSDPEGLDLELAAVETGDLPLIAEADDIPRSHAIVGFDGVRAYSLAPDESDRLLGEVLGFVSSVEGSHRIEDRRHGGYAYDEAPPAPGIRGAGTVHHIAWACPPAQQPRWREVLMAAGANPTPVIDRTYFRSIYFREPSGVLFEIATLGPGFLIDEPPPELGNTLKLPARYESMREELEASLKPLNNPRAGVRPR
ncbi:MAG: VOC family protein [Actinomycetota bacterium]